MWASTWSLSLARSSTLPPSPTSSSTFGVCLIPPPPPFFFSGNARIQLTWPFYLVRGAQHCGGQIQETWHERNASVGGMGGDRGARVAGLRGTDHSLCDSAQRLLHISMRATTRRSRNDQWLPVCAGHRVQSVRHCCGCDHCCTVRTLRRLDCGHGAKAGQGQELRSHQSELPTCVPSYAF